MIQYRKIIISLTLCTVLLGTGVAIAKLLYATRVQPLRHEAPILATVVETILVTQQDIVEKFQGFGTARPDRSAALASEVSSTVLERIQDIEDGSIVVANQPLIRLDTRESMHLLEQAKALAQADMAAILELSVEAEKLKEVISTAQLEVEVARSEKKRVSDLYELGHAAKKENDFAKLAYHQARRVLQGYELELARNEPRRLQLLASKRGHEAARALASLNLDRCTIHAPFAGHIEVLTVDMGDRVSPGMVVLNLVDPSRVEIPIQLPSAVFGRVSVGASVHLSSESMPQVTWIGRVARIAASADAKSRTFAVYIDVDNTKQSPSLLPGTFVSAQVQGVIHKQSLAVPRSAVRDGQLLVIENGVVQVQDVNIIRLTGDQAIVTGALHVGDQVITTYTKYLENGLPVRGQMVNKLHDLQSSTKDVSLANPRESLP